MKNIFILRCFCTNIPSCSFCASMRVCGLPTIMTNSGQLDTVWSVFSIASTACTDRCLFFFLWSSARLDVGGGGGVSASNLPDFTTIITM